MNNIPLKIKFSEIDENIDIKLVYNCPVQWEDMKILSCVRARFCEKCSLKVFDVTKLSPQETKDLIEENEGEVCGQVYVRKGKKVSFEDCKGREAVKTRGRLRID